MSNITPQKNGDLRYYHRAFNFRIVWDLQHIARRKIMNMFMKAMAPLKDNLVLDLGAANLNEPLENFFEHYYPFKSRICAAGIEDCYFLEKRYPGLKYVKIEPGVKLPFDENTFDIGFSNATIEHIGSSDKQALFIAELLRVSKKIFLATPNRWFPIELHTRLPLIHWLPKKIFRAIIYTLGYKFYAKEENLNLLSPKTVLSLIPNNTYKIFSLKYIYFLGFASNIVIVIEK